MSGTSMDGIDAAIIKSDGEKITEICAFEYTAYSDEFRAKLAKLITEKSAADKNFIAETEREFTELNIAAVKSISKKYNGKIDVIGFHGHTIDHNPAAKFTWQIGDGKLLSEKTGVKVVYDFRSNDVKNGGQGAPLIPIYHKAIIPEQYYPALVVNIGGVGNVSYIDNDELIAFDTGPGNALIDDYCKKFFSVNYDDGGKIASQGKPVRAILDELLADDFFAQKPPKSLDRNHFKNKVAEIYLKLNGQIKPEDFISTLTLFTVKSILKSFDHLPKIPKNLILCGGGVKNNYIIGKLEENISLQFEGEEELAICKHCLAHGHAEEVHHHNVQPHSYIPQVMVIDKISDEVKFNPDSIEAEGFAFMAIRTMQNKPISFATTTGIKQKSLVGGVLVGN
jgi:anhydro-N-acetylmuramic acid kinase